MIINGKSLLLAAPIKNMVDHKVQAIPTSYGLSECGYDIRLKQKVTFIPQQGNNPSMLSSCELKLGIGNFLLASAMEEFQMPTNLMGTVRDKSTWARCGLSVFNTVIEPGWNGFLTLELVYHGRERLVLPAGSGIAQVIFEELRDHGHYVGKYQNQADEPVAPITKNWDGRSASLTNEQALGVCRCEPGDVSLCFACTERNK